MYEELKVGDATIRYRDEGSGDVLLFVHGFVQNADAWRKVVPRLSSEFRCVVPDWPLGGHTVPMPEGADLTPTGLARLMVGFIDGLGLENVTLVGNDTGGALTQLVAAHHPDKVARIVLTSCDVYDYFFPPLLRPLQVLARVPGSVRSLGWLLKVPPLQRTPVTFGWLTKHAWSDPDWRAQLDRYLAPGRADKAVRRDIQKVLTGIKPRYTVDAAERLKSFTKPALFVWATEDKLFPVRLGRRLAESMPNARWEEVADSYSYVPEDQPERLAQLIADFVRTPAPSTP